MDKIIIEDLEVYAYHGVAEEEKKLGQMFLVSLEISADLTTAAKNHDLSCTLNYAEVCRVVGDIVSSDKYDLIETVAYKILEGIFINFQKAESVKILLKNLGSHGISS